MMSRSDLNKMPAFQSWPQLRSYQKAMMSSSSMASKEKNVPHSHIRDFLKKGRRHGYELLEKGQLWYQAKIMDIRLSDDGRPLDACLKYEADSASVLIALYSNYIL